MYVIMFISCSPVLEHPRRTAAGVTISSIHASISEMLLKLSDLSDVMLTSEISVHASDIRGLDMRRDSVRGTSILGDLNTSPH